MCLSATLLHLLAPPTSGRDNRLKWYQALGYWQTLEYLSLDLRGLLLGLFELVPQGEDLPKAPVPAARCHGLPVKGDVLLDGGVHQAAVLRLGHGHVALGHDLVRAALRLPALRAFSRVLLLQRQVDTGAGRQRG